MDGMDEKMLFRRSIAAYVDAQPTQAEAARILGLERQTLHRYLKGQSYPRPQRLRLLMRKVRAAPGPDGAKALPDRIASLSDENIVLLRDMMVHLVTLIDLDVGSRGGKERKDG